MTQFHFDPATYDGLIREIPGYAALQAAVVAAAATARPGRVLDLGAGTGTAGAAVLAAHPDAVLVLLDENPAMLAVAATRLPAARVERHVVADLRDPLPAGPFELIVSALAIHHLALVDKRRLFTQVRRVVAPGGRFVMGDVIIPADPADAVIELTADVDRPSRPGELLDGLTDAGFRATVTWLRRDLVVIRADDPNG